jgi:GNAT superfamily N-acetyltransferase
MDPTPSPVLIRTALPADVPALAELATHLGYPATPEAMRERFDRIYGRDDYETYVAERDGRVVGFAGVMHGLSYVYDPPYARLLSLVVAPGERGSGTGAALVAAAERWARWRGAGQLHLTTALHRDGAHRFYERLGYERTGARYARKLPGESS